VSEPPRSAVVLRPYLLEQYAPKSEPKGKRMRKMRDSMLIAVAPERHSMCEA
jgi:hypothetical protein